MPRDTFRVDVRHTKQAVAALGRLRTVLNSKRLMERYGPKIADLIRERTAAGRDINDARFARKVDGSASNLKKTGTLHDAIDYSKSRRQVYVRNIGRPSRQKIGEIHQKQAKVLRRFMGISRRDAHELDRDTAKFLDREIRRAARPGMTVRGRAFRRQTKYWRRTRA